MTNQEMILIVAMLVVCLIFLALLIVYNVKCRFTANHQKLLSFLLFACSVYIVFSELALGFNKYSNSSRYGLSIFGAIIWMVNAVIYAYRFYKQF